VIPATIGAAQPQTPKATANIAALRAGLFNLMAVLHPHGSRHDQPGKPRIDASERALHRESRQTWPDG